MFQRNVRSAGTLPVIIEMESLLHSWFLSPVLVLNHHFQEIWWGNLGGFLGTILLEALRVGTSYLYSIVYLVVVMAIATVLIFTIPETGRKVEIAQ